MKLHINYSEPLEDHSFSFAKPYPPVHHKNSLGCNSSAVTAISGGHHHHHFSQRLSLSDHHYGHQHKTMMISGNNSHEQWRAREKLKQQNQEKNCLEQTNYNNKQRQRQKRISDAGGQQIARGTQEIDGTSSLDETTNNEAIATDNLEEQRGSLSTRLVNKFKSAFFKPERRESIGELCTLNHITSLASWLRKETVSVCVLI